MTGFIIVTLLLLGLIAVFFLWDNDILDGGSLWGSDWGSVNITVGSFGLLYFLSLPLAYKIPTWIFDNPEPIDLVTALLLALVIAILLGIIIFIIPILLIHRLIGLGRRGKK